MQKWGGIDLVLIVAGSYNEMPRGGRGRVRPADRRGRPGERGPGRPLVRSWDFHREADRVLRPGGLLAVWCYGLSTVNAEVDAAVREIYDGLLGPWWPPQRRQVDEGYRGMPFPYPELPARPWATRSKKSGLGLGLPGKKRKVEKSFFLDRSFSIFPFFPLDR